MPMSPEKFSQNLLDITMLANENIENEKMKEAIKNHWLLVGEAIKDMVKEMTVQATDSQGGPVTTTLIE